MSNQITAWSYSRLRDYKTCPLKAKFKYIDKLSEPGNAAMERGSEIHELAENYIRGHIRCIPKELKAFEGLFKELKKALDKGTYPVFVENQMAFTRDWDVTGWYDKDVSLRMILDLVFIKTDEQGREVAYVIDWKTGKNDNRLKDSYEEQLELFATGTLIKFPDVDAVIPALYYLDEGTTYLPECGEYGRKALEKLKKKWFKESKKILSDRKFPKKPNDTCRWCHFRKDNGGPCPI